MHIAYTIEQLITGMKIWYFVLMSINLLFYKGLLMKRDFGSRIFLGVGVSAAAVALGLVVFFANSRLENRLQNKSSKIVEKSFPVGLNDDEPNDNSGPVVDRKPSKANDDEYVQWQFEAGYRRPEGYEKMSKDELEKRSRAGDKFASQKLGELVWAEIGDREGAVKWLKKAAEQGSIAALTQTSSMYDPDSDVFLVHRLRFGETLKGDRVEAYIWARLAAMRGDPDAIFGMEKQAKYLGAKEVTQLEFLAAEQYRQLQDNYARLNGRGFINNYPKNGGPHEQILDSGHY